MKPFKCIKQLILHSGIYVLLSSSIFSHSYHYLHVSSMSVIIHNVREQVLGDFENQNQTDRAIKLLWAPLLKYLEVRNNTKKLSYYLIQ